MPRLARAVATGFAHHTSIDFINAAGIYGREDFIHAVWMKDTSGLR